MSDQLRCVVLGRDSPRKDWEFIVHTEKKSVAWTAALTIQNQERFLGNKSFESKVVTLADYDQGKLRSNLKAPADFKAPQPPTNTQKAIPETKIRVPKKNKQLSWG